MEGLGGGFWIFVALIGLIPAAIAHRKGRNFFAWWVYGALLFIVALIHALVLKEDVRSLEDREVRSGERTRCPHCQELVRVNASVCKHCGRSLVSSEG